MSLQRLHEHWPVEVSYINVTGMSYHLTSLLDGFSGAIETYDDYYKKVWLHSLLGYATSMGLDTESFSECDHKLESTRET